MKILIVSQFFPPEMGAPAARFFDFARTWVASGHAVSVITAFPNFPNGTIPKKYKGKIFLKELINGIITYRGFIFASPRLNSLTKGLGYISFIISSIAILLLVKIKYDIVISTSPPPLMGLPGILAARLKKVPLIFDVRDIWPEAIILSGRIKNPILIKLLEWVEMMLYYYSALITVVTEGKKDRLIERGILRKKIAVMPNGVDIKLFDEYADHKLPENLQKLVKQYKCFSYAGVINPAQGLEVLIEAGEILRRDHKKLYDKLALIVLGDGSQRKRLEDKKNNLHLNRIFFMGIYPREVVFSLLKKSAANIITLAPRKDSHTVPSKIYESLVSGRPVILSADGESANIIKNANGGIVSLPGDAEMLANSISRYALDSELSDKHGLSARSYCIERYDRSKIAIKFLGLLSELKCMS
jgi:glycosyltransferase involved in cell wall biosynthesis